jgi:hypothetical protein
MVLVANHFSFSGFESVGVNVCRRRDIAAAIGLHAGGQTFQANPNMFCIIIKELLQKKREKREKKREEGEGEGKRGRIKRERRRE